MSIMIAPTGNTASLAEVAQTATYGASQTGGVTSAEGVSVKFAPGMSGSAPLDRIGGGIADKLRQFEDTRATKDSAMSRMTGGPASAYDAARAELTSGPASLRPGGVEATRAPAQPTMDDAVNAMTKTFDYAIETQLIVKTGSQFSTSLSSLMRGQ